MWDRFTEAARKVVFYAQEEAGARGLNVVDTEHLLLGLVRDRTNGASRVLAAINVSGGDIRRALTQSLPRGFGPLGKSVELTSRSKHALNLAFEQSQLLGDDQVNTEHMLLGLLLEDGSSSKKPDVDTEWPPAPTGLSDPGIASKTLSMLGVTVDDVLKQIQLMRSKPAPTGGLSGVLRTVRDAVKRKSN